MPCAGPVTTARAHRQSGVVVAGYVRATPDDAVDAMEFLPAKT